MCLIKNIILFGGLIYAIYAIYAIYRPPPINQKPQEPSKPANDEVNYIKFPEVKFIVEELGDGEAYEFGEIKIDHSDVYVAGELVAVYGRFVHQIDTDLRHRINDIIHSVYMEAYEKKSSLIISKETEMISNVLTAIDKMEKTSSSNTKM